MENAVKCCFGTESKLLSVPSDRNRLNLISITDVRNDLDCLMLLHYQHV
jgi:hypothetical protein